MLIVKKRMKIKNKSLTIELPKKFIHHDLEVTVRVKRDIEKELLSDQIKIDTKKWKFNREEIYAK